MESIPRLHSESRTNHEGPLRSDEGYGACPCTYDTLSKDHPLLGGPGYLQLDSNSTCKLGIAGLSLLLGPMNWITIRVVQQIVRPLSRCQTRRTWILCKASNWGHHIILYKVYIEPRVHAQHGPTTESRVQGTWHPLRTQRRRLRCRRPLGPGIRAAPTSCREEAGMALLKSQVNSISAAELEIPTPVKKTGCTHVCVRAHIRLQICRFVYKFVRK